MTNLFRKRSVVAGAAALALVGATLRVAGAQQTPSLSPSPNVPSPIAPGTQQQPPTNAPVPGQGAQGQNRPTPEQKQQQRQQFLNAVASRLNISATQLQQAIDAARQELGIPESGPGGRGGHLGGRGGGLDAAAQALGISVDQLRQELSGRTLADVAQARNVNPTTVANAMKTAAYAKIDAAAAAGRIPADQVATTRQQAAQRIDQMMTQQGPVGRPVPGGTLGRSFR